MTNLVAAITQLSESDCSNNCERTFEGDNDANASNIESTIRTLFPSANGRSSTTTTVGGAATTAANTSMHHTSPLFNPSVNYGGGKKSKRSKTSKNNNGKKLKLNEARTTLKDVVLIPYSRQTKVPRGREREAIFSSGFLSTFELDPSMDEEGIRTALESKFAVKFSNTRKSPKFEFMRAVHSKLISLETDGCPKCDGRLLKHVSGQGPIYIRAKEDISVSVHSLVKIEDDDSSDDISSEDDDIILKTTMFEDQFTSSFSSQNLGDNLKSTLPPLLHSSSLHDISHETSSVAATSTTSSILCPTCNMKFKIDEIEEHADLCCESAWKGTEQHYVSIMSQFKRKDDQNQPKDDQDHHLSSDAAAENTELLQFSLLDELKRLEKNLDQTTNCVNVQRISILNDYLDRRIKCSWFSPKNKIKVVFIGEPAVDDGGPRREFFSGNVTEKINLVHNVLPFNVL